MGGCVSKDSGRVAGSDGLVSRSESREKGFRAQLVRHAAIDDIKEIYDVEEELGSGMSGAVHRVRKLDTGERFAMKTVHLNRIDADMLEDLRTEIALLKQLDHPNVIKLYETYEDKRRMYLIMELCTGGELFDRLVSQDGKRYSEQDAARVVRQMCQAISYIHHRSICHRDLKLENFVFESQRDDAALKLIDFGLSKKFVAGLRMQSMVGTPYYLAPEVLHGHAYGLPCDIWGLGVITYILLCGKPPFNGQTNTAILFKVAKGKYTFHHPVWNVISDEAKDFIRHLLKFNPKKRPAIREVLRHPWLNDIESNPSKPLDAGIVTAISAFSKDALLKRAALEAIAFSLNPSQLSELRDAFIAMDRDHTGYLSGEEFSEALRAHGASDEQIGQMFKDLDQDGTGSLSYTEFLAASIRRKQYMTEERLQEAFDKLDVDNSGYITRENLQHVLGDDYDPARVDAMIAEADIKGDNRVSYEEFLRLFRDNLDNMREGVAAAARAAGVPATDDAITDQIIQNPDIPDPTTVKDTPRTPAHAESQSGAANSSDSS